MSSSGAAPGPDPNACPKELFEPGTTVLDVPRVEDVPLDGRPLSPFAQKYGVSPIVFWRLHHPDGRAHSSLAPDVFLGGHFTSDPKASWNQFLDAARNPTPNLERIDRIFRAEAEQVQKSMMGLRMWQTLPLRENLYDWPAQHHSPNVDSWAEYARKLVRVDEDKWLRCLRRDHWLDLRTNPLTSLDKPVPGLGNGYQPYPDQTWWSVDNDVIWAGIRPALEVVSRVLVQMCNERHRWLDMMLFGDPQPWESPKPDFGDHTVPAYRLYSRGSKDRATSDELLQELENRTAENLMFTLLDESTGTAYHCHGETTFSQSNALRCIVRISAVEIRPLFEMDTTVSEKCLALFSLVTVTLHELGHVLWGSRFPKGEFIDFEPFIEDDWISEAGWSMEQTVFGGVVDRMPRREYTHLGLRGLNTHMCITPFPSRLLCTRIPRDRWEGNAHRRWAKRGHARYAVPNLWLSAILCENFWTTVVHTHGITTLRAPRLICCQVDTANNTHTARRVQPPPLVIKELKPGCDRVLSQWQEAKSAVHVRAGEWYETEYRAWKLLPWSNAWFRNGLDAFIHFHSKRDFFHCRKQANNMKKYLDALLGTLDAPPEPSAMEICRVVVLLMSCSLPWVTDDVALGPKRTPLYTAHWPSSAARAGWLNSRSKGKYFGPWVWDHRRQESVPTANLFDTPTQFINTLKADFETLEQRQGGPLPWMKNILNCLIEIEQERQEDPAPDTWTSFSFVVPPYEPGWVTAKMQMMDLSVPIGERYTPVLPWQDASLFQDLSPPTSPIMAPKVSSTAAKDGSRKVAPRVAARDPASQRLQLSSRRPYPKYFYIGSVADHRSLVDAWVIEPDDNSGFDVFDITGVLKDVKATEGDYLQIVISGPQGPTLRADDRRADYIRGMFGVALRPIGKLIIHKRIEEIAERNGQDGQPAWTTWGPHVYDITEDFPPQSPEEREALLQSAGGPLFETLKRPSAPATGLRDRLRPYLCAYLDLPIATRQTMRHFTPRTLRWYDNPDIGVYIALDNIVFDISIYSRFHPGGNQLFLDYTGRDATRAFESHHSLTLMKSYEHLQVGYLVPEIRMEDMEGNHVAIHRWIFDISPLETADPRLYRTLRDYTGIDTTAAIGGESAGANALVTLFLSRKDLIVAGLARAALPDIPEGEVAKHRNHNHPDGAMVIVDGYVYNVTHIMRHPGFYRHRIGPNWAGKELTNPAWAHWLATNFEARRIGRLVQGPAWPTPHVGVALDEPEQEFTGIITRIA
ncbi:hypothetical protein F4677DRAFT_451708 [Hypoxylon crocopeplum]|nr:hypothetical protein F4677DRAFT_451708 [Hypoxylon crocopeplum]